MAKGVGTSACASQLDIASCRSPHHHLLDDLRREPHGVPIVRDGHFKRLSSLKRVLEPPVSFLGAPGENGRQMGLLDFDWGASFVSKYR